MQRNYKKLIQYTIDSILLILSLSISISVLQTETTLYLPEYLGLFFLNLLIISLIFYPFGQYNYVFRFISINDFRVIILLLISYIY